MATVAERLKTVDERLKTALPGISEVLGNISDSSSNVERDITALKKLVEEREDDTELQALVSSLETSSETLLNSVPQARQIADNLKTIADIYQEASTDTPSTGEETPPAGDGSDTEGETV
jgi:ABC-type transporter Mla subunit MlaD